MSSDDHDVPSPEPDAGGTDASTPTDRSEATTDARRSAGASPADATPTDTAPPDAAARADDPPDADVLSATRVSAEEDLPDRCEEDLFVVTEADDDAVYEGRWFSAPTDRFRDLTEVR
jgi:hypothetical protein